MTRWTLVLAGCVGAVAVAQKSDDAWDRPTMTLKELVDFLPLDMKTQLGAMEAPNAKALKDELVSAERLIKDPADRVSYATTMSAVLEGVGFTQVARVYADWAVLQKPDSKVAVANVGAVSCYPPILRLGVQLDPKNPVPLTNLGSCAMSVKKWDVAKDAYEKAIALDPNHLPAFDGLGQWYLHVPDLPRALEYFARANTIFAINRRDEKGKPVPPDAPVEPKFNRMGGGPAAPAAEGEGDGPGGSSDRLVLPDLPKWTSPDAFIRAGPGRKPLADFYAEKMGEGLEMAITTMKSNPLKRIAEAQARADGMSDAAALAEALKPRWSDGEVNAALALNAEWLLGKQRKADEAFAAAQKEYRAVRKNLESIAKKRNGQIEAACPRTMSMSQLKQCFERMRKEVVASCKETTALNGKLFATYRDAYERWYAALKPALEEYYRVQGLWLRQVSDPTVFKAAAVARESVVFSPLAGKMMEEDLMRIALAGIGWSAFGATAEICPENPAVSSDEGSPPVVPKVKKPEQKCPLPKDGFNPMPFSIPGIKMPLSVTVWCTEIEAKLTWGLEARERVDEFGKKVGNVEAGADAVLSVRHRFGSDKSTTIYVGVEAGMKTGTAYGETSVKAELGASITFDRNWQPTAVGGKAGVTSSLTLPGDVGTGNLGFVAAIEKGSPSVSFNADATPKKLLP